MTHERLVHLMEVYGASPARWPVDERAAAQALIAAPNAAGIAARAAFQHAASLDAELDTYTVVSPDPELMRKIAASAVVATPQQVPLRQKPRRRLSVDWRTPRHWLSGGRLIGAGLLSAGIIGLATGLLTTSLLAPSGMGAGASTTNDEPVYGGTIFSSTSSDWSDQ